MKDRTAIKLELMKKVEAVIDELLDWQEVTEEPNLSQVEEKVLDLRQRLSEQMAVTVIEHQAAVRPVPGPRYTSPVTRKKWRASCRASSGYAPPRFPGFCCSGAVQRTAP